MVEDAHEAGRRGLLAFLRRSLHCILVVDGSVLVSLLPMFCRPKNAQFDGKRLRIQKSERRNEASAQVNFITRVYKLSDLRKCRSPLLIDSVASKSAVAESDLEESGTTDPGRLMDTAARVASCEFLRERKDFGGSFSLRFPPPLKKFPGRKSGRPEEEGEEEREEDDEEESPSLLSC